MLIILLILMLNGGYIQPYPLNFPDNLIILNTGGG